MRRKFLFQLYNGENGSHSKQKLGKHSVLNVSSRNGILRLFARGVAVLIFLFANPICTKAGQLDGQGLVCVGVKAPGEDLFYGFVFDSGRVKALSILRGGLYVPPDDEDVPYTVNDADYIVWQSRGSLHETRTPSSGFTHSVDKRSLKHNVFGKKGGFEGGLCFFETGAGVKSLLLQKIQIPQG